MGAHLADEIDLRFFEHGGRLDIARAAYPEAPEPWIDLSTGISPWAFPAPQTPQGRFHRLPDEEGLRRLTEFARKAYKVPPMSAVVPLPGSDAGLSILPWLFREPKRVAVVAPCYPGHAKAWNAAGHSVNETGWLDRVGNAAIVVAANPNNPDGRFIEHAKLAAALPLIRHRNGLLVVDEAFADADESHSLLPHVARLDYTLVFRSIGKFYGAGGVRLGFAITQSPRTRWRRG
jgi:cobalamin biosynthesis protein CobC